MESTGLYPIGWADFDVEKSPSHHIIYAIISTSEPGHYRYIGQTRRDISSRLSVHLSEARAYSKSGSDIFGRVPWSREKQLWLHKNNEDIKVKALGFVKPSPYPNTYTHRRHAQDVEESVILEMRQKGHKLFNKVVGLDCWARPYRHLILDDDDRMELNLLYKEAMFFGEPSAYERLKEAHLDILGKSWVSDEFIERRRTLWTFEKGRASL